MHIGIHHNLWISILFQLYCIFILFLFYPNSIQLKLTLFYYILCNFHLYVAQCVLPSLMWMQMCGRWCWSIQMVLGRPCLKWVLINQQGASALQGKTCKR